LKRLDTNGVLVDTCVWIEFFKTDSAISLELENLIKTDSIWICGIVLLELIQGVRSEDEKNKIIDALSGFKYVEMSKSLWQRAGELLASLKKKGFNLPLSDILVSTIALERNLRVFTFDKHFAHIPDLKLHKIE
jgi:predicted nucleic acid-binding protein